MPLLICHTTLWYWISLLLEHLSILEALLLGDLQGRHGLLQGKPHAIHQILDKGQRCLDTALSTPFGCTLVFAVSYDVWSHFVKSSKDMMPAVHAAFFSFACLLHA